MINKNLFVPIILGAALLAYAYSAFIIISCSFCSSCKDINDFAQQYCQIMNTTIGGLFLAALGVERYRGKNGSAFATAGRLFATDKTNTNLTNVIGFIVYSLYVVIGFAFILSAFNMNADDTGYQFILDLANSFVGIIVSILIASLTLTQDAYTEDEIKPRMPSHPGQNNVFSNINYTEGNETEPDLKLDLVYIIDSDSPPQSLYLKVRHYDGNTWTIDSVSNDSIVVTVSGPSNPGAPIISSWKSLGMNINDIDDFLELTVKRPSNRTRGGTVAKSNIHR